MKSSRNPVFSPEILAAILAQRLGVTPETPLKVAYSGGLDSHALLHALCAMRRQAPWRVSAVHVDHGLQPVSRDWSRRCEAACGTLNVPIVVERITVSRIRDDGLEAAARRARYACLARHVGPGELLLTAHHQDDQAETLLLQLLRGAGPHGLAAMPELTPFARGRLARPLLRFPRSSLLAYATAEGLDWIDDASNFDIGLARNFVRHRVLPVIAGRWPRAAAVLSRSARHAAEAAALLDELAATDLGLVQSQESGALHIPALMRLSPARRRNLLRYWMRRQGLPAPSEIQLAELLRRTETAPQTHHATVSWPGAEVHRYRDRLMANARAAVPLAWPSLSWDLSGPLDIEPVQRRLRAVPSVGQGLSLARLAGSHLSVRPRRGGEVCELSGRGHHHKLKKLLQEAGVPPQERTRLPLLYADDALAAVADRWICEPFAARAGEPSIVLVVEPIPRDNANPAEE